MKTLNLELVFDDNTDEINVKIAIRKGGEVDVKTLPPSLPNKNESTGDGTSDPVKKPGTTKKKRTGGNFMDAEF